MDTFATFKHEPDVRTYSAGDPIFAEGDANNSLMYALLEGDIDILRGGRLLETIHPVGVFGEMSLLDLQPRSASATARTDCRVAAISEQRLKTLVSENPQLAIDLMRMLADRVRRNMAR
jgi:CRP/FNR family cyclic AMP-dependent transcriptional regulator